MDENQLDELYSNNILADSSMKEINLSSKELKNLIEKMNRNGISFLDAEIYSKIKGDAS
jgi:predicted oxidoreductase